MSTITIRNLDDSVKQQLRKRAAERGVSMEQEVRDALAERIAGPRQRKSILEDLRRLGANPDKPFEQKKISDEMWDEGLL